MQNAIQDDKLQQLQAGLAKIKEKFIESLPEKVAEFDALLDELYEDKDAETIVDEIGKRAHKLHGQAGSFGFAEVGAMAARLEQEVLNVKDGPRPVNTEGVEAHLVALLDQIDASLGAT